MRRIRTAWRLWRLMRMAPAVVGVRIQYAVDPDGTITVVLVGSPVHVWPEVVPPDRPVDRLLRLLLEGQATALAERAEREVGTWVAEAALAQGGVDGAGCRCHADRRLRP